MVVDEGGSNEAGSAEKEPDCLHGERNERARARGNRGKNEGATTRCRPSPPPSSSHRPVRLFPSLSDPAMFALRKVSIAVRPAFGSRSLSSLVFLEHRRGAISPASLSAVTAAQSIGGDVSLSLARKVSPL